jgi:hypothetical protein
MERLQAKIVDAIKQDPDVSGAVSVIGASPINSTPNAGHLAITLKSRDERSAFVRHVGPGKAGLRCAEVVRITHQNASSLYGCLALTARAATVTGKLASSTLRSASSSSSSARPYRKAVAANTLP